MCGCQQAAAFRAYPAPGHNDSSLAQHLASLKTDLVPQCKRTTRHYTDAPVPHKLLEQKEG